MKLDYLNIFERAWKITWRHKILWLFGFLSLFGSCSSNSNYNPGSSGSSSGGTGGGSAERFAEQAQEFLAHYWPLVLIIGLFLLLVSIALLVVGYIARGGLIHMAAQFDSGAAPKAGEGFRRGMHYWLRLLGIDFVLFAPLVVLILVLVGIGVLVAVLASPGLLAGLGGGSDAAATAAGGVAGGICCIFALVGLFIVVLIPVVIFLGVLQVLAHRACVLDDERVLDAVRKGYRLIRTRFGDVALVWLIRLVIGIVIGIATLLAALILFGLPIALIFVNVFLGIALMIPGVVVMALVTAVIEAFSSAAWTIAYRDLTAPAPEQPATIPAPAT